jgi:predicted PhzF superfamily epimerase YddE/YHI9
MHGRANSRIPVFRLDAFSNGPLNGSPAAVCQNGVELSVCRRADRAGATIACTCES